MRFCVSDKGIITEFVLPYFLVTNQSSADASYIIVLNDDCSQFKAPMASRGRGVVLLNSDKVLLCGFGFGGDSAQLITYGLNSRACITASSIEEDDVQICLQRGFTTVSGSEALPQEFSVSTPGLGAYVAMALAGALLACGIQAPEITKIMKGI